MSYHSCPSLPAIDDARRPIRLDEEGRMSPLGPNELDVLSRQWQAEFTRKFITRVKLTTFFVGRILTVNEQLIENALRLTRQGFAGTPSDGFSPGDDDTDHLRFRLAKTEEEIETLRQALLSKEKSAADLRRQLGLGPLENLKHNLSKGWQDVRTSSPYLTASAVLEDIGNTEACVRTKEGLAHAGRVTSSALSNVGVAITRRLAEMRALPLPGPPRGDDGQRRGETSTGDDESTFE
ncbi:tumor protein D54-like isoform X4 [Corythoichthys intestinalis]|uniref:tumor protein D54-like isoform X4 n=1 Tax=Corythoichthys intestinalis TaxID=161448 RepID=UPI0025A5DD16|nr:tumor protein D54-like isoform X4 [Corythoichthys intestinalis]